MNWKEVAERICKGRTILVLGPDAIPLYPKTASAIGDLQTEYSYNQIVHKKILEELGGKIKHYYKRDELFLFDDTQTKTKAWHIAEDVISDRKWLPDEELLRKIVAIPFPVILNINPDKYIYDAFIKYWSKPQFDYLTPHDKSGDYKIEHDPECYNHPIVYNLCGSVLDAPESVILDHFDLFGLLQVIFKEEDNVSGKLIRKLNGAQQFILLGFDMERWYFQIFLHYINRLGKKAFDTYKENLPILSHVSEDTREFVMKQFNIEYFAPSRDAFEQLYSACAEMNVLRKINDPASPILEQLRILAEKDMESAFNLFEQNCREGEVQTLELPLLRGRYSDWLKKRELNMEDPKEINRIRHDLLTLANETFNKTDG